MKKVFITTILMFMMFMILLLVGCQQKEQSVEQMVTVSSKTMEINEQQKSDSGYQIINLKTEDNINIVANYYPNDHADTAVILLHMLNRNRNDWDDFAKRLDNAYAVVAIDLRGHGDSDLDWHNFNSVDFQAMTKDIKAARNFLREVGFDRFFIIGASIGANLAIVHAAEDNTMKAVVALSPSNNYHGIKTPNAARGLGVRPLMLVYAKNDHQSARDAESLFKLAPAPGGKLISLEGSAHGTNMLDRDLQDEILVWLSTLES
ncbi:hypothetical protein DRJ17_02400 [Candidatus Woesearchaeota archaeon]|nr:MAG: hypothetical protein DRJ17_02400 [Candidatus Woesearchaeota archaeon]